jgi:hypothetical protein
MKRLLQLTAIPHPDLNGGQPYPVFVDPEHIVLIERTKTSQELYEWRDEQNDLACRFWQEVQRCDSELTQLAPRNFIPDNEQDAEKLNLEMRRWLDRKDISASIHAAYGIIANSLQKPRYYPTVECTCIQLAVPNARHTMLPAVYVTETPEEVAEKILGAYR